MNRLAAVSRRLPTLAVVALLAVLIGYPIGLLLWRTIVPEDRPAQPARLFGPFVEAFTNDATLSALWGTLWLTAIVLVIAVPLAVLLAWAASCTDAPLAGKLAFLPIISLAISPLVGAIGWLILLSPRAGLLNVLLRSVFGMDSVDGPLDAHSQPVIILVMVLYIVPYIYGPTFAAFARIDGSLFEAARASGASTMTAVRTVVVPVIRPAILAGTLIGGVSAAAVFAIPLVLAGGTGLRVIPTLIYQAVVGEGRLDIATALASILGALTIVGMALYLRALGPASFATITGKGLRRLRIRLGGWRFVLTGIVVVYLCLSIVLPLGALVYLSFSGFWSANVFSQPLSLGQYDLILNSTEHIRALVNSGWISALAASLALLLGSLGAYVALRRGGRVGKSLSYGFILPIGIPPIVAGVAILYAFVGPPFPLYGTVAIMVVGYVVIALPVSFQYAESGLRQIGRELAEAAQTVGDTPGGTLLRITAPLVRRPLFVAWGIVFINLFRDLGVSVMVYTPQTLVAPISLLGFFETGSLPTAAAYSVVITVVSGVVVWVILFLNHERRQKERGRKTPLSAVGR
ncbi:ABC transporter permease [Actinophytocola sp.]|uniref:ABC transporter permease n=1 Tax=Actinophytocola sp. TaxID=1872138 RepID=UPI003D6C4906